MTVETPSVAVALVNWNGWRDTLACFETLAKISNPPLDFYLCDNASGDDSVEQIARWARTAGWTVGLVDHIHDGAEATVFLGSRAPPRLTLIRNYENAGFARGTNIAMRYALASGRPYLAMWVLNTDTLVDPHAVESGVAALLAQPHAGSVQSLLLGYPNDAVIDSAGVRLLRRGGAKYLLRGRTPADLGPPQNHGLIAIFGCCAASAFYRTTALQEVGLFDEELFQTNEDVDLACRLQAAGYSAFLAPQSVVRHKGGVSRRRKRGRMWFIANRAKLRVVARWWPRQLAVPALVIGALRALLVMARTGEVSAGAWVALLRELWRDYCGGATGVERQNILAAGSRGFL